MREGAFFLANGLVVPYGDGRVRSRGYEARTIRAAIQDVEAAWREFGIEGSVRLIKQQFVGVKAALTCEDDSVYGEWLNVVTIQSFSPAPTREFYQSENGIVYSTPMLVGIKPPGSLRRVPEFLNHKERHIVNRFVAGLRLDLPEEIRRKWELDGGASVPAMSKTADAVLPTSVS